MGRTVKQSRKRIPQRSTRKTRRRQEAGCTCTVKLDAKNPISLHKVEAGLKGTFKPNFEKEPNCAGDGCELQVHYQWSIEVKDGAPVLTNDTEEMATVTGLGWFKLTVDVSVGCVRVVHDYGGGHKLMAVTPCSDTGSQTYAVV